MTKSAILSISYTFPTVPEDKQVRGAHSGYWSYDMYNPHDTANTTRQWRWVKFESKRDRHYMQTFVIQIQCAARRRKAVVRVNLLRMSSIRNLSRLDFELELQHFVELVRVTSNITVERLKETTANIFQQHYNNN